MERDSVSHHQDVTWDLEHSQQWTSLASQINDLERSSLRHQRKRILYRRSMPEPQYSSLIYGDVNSDDWGESQSGIRDHSYNQSTDRESIAESVDSWSWRPETDYSKEKIFYGNNNYQKLDYNRPEVPEREAKNRKNLAKKTSEDNSETAYRGSREKLHEIFQRNRDLRRQFFAEGVHKQSSKNFEPGEKSNREKRKDKAISEALENAKNLKFADQTKSLRSFGDSKDERRFHSSLEHRKKTLDGGVEPQSPAPPLPTSEPPDSFLISKNRPPDPPDCVSSVADLEESEGLRMLERFETRIESRKLSSRKEEVCKSMPELSQDDRIEGKEETGGRISRLLVNGSAIDLHGEFSTQEYVECGLEPREIHATRVELVEEPQLRDRRRMIPSPLDLSGVQAALRREEIHRDRGVLRNYSVENDPLRGEIVKCKVTLVENNQKEEPRLENALRIATDVLNGTKKDSRSLVPIIGSKSPAGGEEENDETISRPGRFRTSVVVWCDGNTSREKESNGPEARTTTGDRQGYSRSIRRVAGNVDPSIYAPIPYSQYLNRISNSSEANNLSKTIINK